MTESTSPMHGEAAGAPLAPQQVQCRACTLPFTPRKRWQHFCSPKCRNDWHSWTRPAAVREARSLISEALPLSVMSEQWQARARKLLGIK